MGGDGPGPPVGSIEVHGGPGGTTARLDDLDRAGSHLLSAARRMTAVALRVARLAADPSGVVTAAASPITWLATERSLAGAVGPPDGAVVVAARLTAFGTAARGASGVYRTADAAADAALHNVDVTVGRAVGTLAAVPVVAAVGASPVSVVAGATQIVVLAGLAGGRPAKGDQVGLGDVLLSLLAAHGGVAEHVVAATPSMIDGAIDAVPGLARVAAAVTGKPTLPADVPGAAAWLGAVGWLGGLGSAGPWLHETGRVSVVARRAVAARPPSGIADLIGGIAMLDSAHAQPGTVRVVAVTHAGGRRAWVVQVPGTQDWSPRAGPNPNDLTGNIRGMAGQRTAGRELVVAALRSAGVRPGEPVLLAGHSQGGIVAAQLAADPEFRKSYAVTHVVTAGAPVASVRVPESVSVLSLEHDEDLVTRLDGAVNPDRAGWVTVSRSTTPAGGAADLSVAHGLPAYTRTAAAADSTTDPGLVRWRLGLEPFLAGLGVRATALEVTGRRR